MSYLSKMMDTALSALLENTVSQRTGKVAAKVLGTPSVGPAIDRELDRQAQRFMATDLGMPMKTRYRDVYHWVDEVFLDLYPAQAGGDVHWCSQWWAHPAAVRRLTMMWASWEAHRAENPATGEEIWARVVGDYHFRWLTGTYSPFTRCSNSHKPSPLLDSEPMPLTDPAADPATETQQTTSDEGDKQ